MRTLLLALMTGCTVPNPAFDPPETTSTTAPATGETTAPTTGAGPDETTGTIASSSSGAVEPTSTTSATTTTSATSTTSATTGDDTTGDSTTGEARSCWAMGVLGWPVAGQPLDAFIDVSPTDPFLTPDGLGLYYIALAERRPFLSARASRLDEFPNGKQLAIWANDPKYQPGYPAVVLGGEEMLINNGGDVYTSTHTPGETDKYSPPLKLGGPSTNAVERHLTATADGAVLIVSREDGPAIAPFWPRFSPRFYQYTRAVPQPGVDFVGGDDVTPAVGTLNLALCPVLAPDGLHLFFASTTALTLVDADDVIGMYYTRREDLSAPWAPAEKVPIENGEGGVVCPSSVSADGCDLAYHQFHADGSGYAMFLAARAP